MLALAFILVLIRLGGFSLLRLLLPLAFLAGVVYLVRLYGKEQEWW